MDMMEIRRRIILASQPKIPFGYQEVEYVIGLGRASQIDTDISGADYNGLSFDMAFEINNWGAYRSIFGNVVDGESNGWRIMQDGVETSHLYFSGGGRVRSNKILKHTVSHIGKKTNVHLEYSYASVTIDGITESVELDSRLGSENDEDLCIGYSNVHTSSTAAGYQTKWYYFQARRNGVLIADYVPCFRKSDGKVGFYDIASRTFRTSYNETDFVLE